MTWYRFIIIELLVLIVKNYFFFTRSIEYHRNLTSSTIVDNNFHLFYYENTVYGNEYQQAQYYFDIIDSSNISKSKQLESFKLYYRCFSEPFKLAIKCSQSINSQYENITTIASDYANTYSNDSFVKSMDCNYDISLRNVKFVGYPRGSYHFHFTIEENHCKSNISIPSGSSFDVYGISNSYLVSCKQYSRNNSNIYDIICIIPEIYADILNDFIIPNNNNLLCINITVFLMGMHFDNFNEYIITSTKRFFRVLNDNKQYCYPVYNINIIPSSLLYNNKRNIWYYTGEWLPNHQPNYYFYESTNIIKHLQSYDHHLTYKKTEFNGNPFHIRESKIFGKFPYLFNHVNDSRLYRFNAIVYPQTNNYRNLTNNISYYKSILSNDRNEYYFIGSSHMRYNFDAIAMYLYGDDILNNISRKHEFTHLYNLFDLSYQAASSLFADDQGDHLINVCDNFESNKRKNIELDINKTIFFQTGAWDINYTPLSRVINFSLSGLKLLSIIQRILSLDLPCGNLNHFVWLTSVPYPPCLIDESEECSYLAGHRINAGIAALNQFYIKHLLNMNISSQIKFSIIDVYSIIKPRLIFHHFNEVVCYCHYLCRITVIYRGPPVLLHTSGGDAVIDTILLAMLNHILLN